MTILWRNTPDRMAVTGMAAFLDHVRAIHGLDLPDYEALYQWSVREIPAFWSTLRDFCEIVVPERGERVLVSGEHMSEARFFPEDRLNYSENLLQMRGDGEAIVFRNEQGYSRRITHEQLRGLVGQLATTLRDAGIVEGDRIAACLPDIPEAAIGLLAGASFGAIWSSCSPDFGVQGMLDRFQQIAPAVLIACDGYYYGGKQIDIRARLAEVVAGLPSLRLVIIVPYLADTSGKAADCEIIPGAVLWHDFVARSPVCEPGFIALPFNHPLYILYSSGTTGLPKCIVHGAGGTLLQHLKEHRLHSDIRPGDRVFYFTTCGWMMWNWQISALASGATLMLYDGSPFWPDGEVLIDYAAEERFTFFGTSAKYLQSLEKHGIRPAATHALPALRTIASTGSPLSPASFDYVYRDFKADVCLSSISGGTDIVSCFVLGNPLGPVIRGEIQARGLGMAVEVWDESGKPVTGQRGELVCTRPFPSMPVAFWNDPDRSRYRSAYFERFPGVWAHGDFAEITASGGVIIHGRSDAVLNPGGVRIGTAEIYRQVETLDEVLEAVAVGHEREGDTDVLLFVVLRDGLILDDVLIRKLRDCIRSGASPRHVPAAIYQVTDIPRTRSGKITEVAVRDIINGREIKNGEALANPEALEAFRILARTLARAPEGAAG